MSRMTLPNPRSAPASSWSAVIVTCARNSEPSLRTRQLSSSIRPQACAREVGVRPARGDIVGGIEDREVAADDLRLRPALDPLGAAVPDRHPALRIEHVDRIGRGAIDQQPEFLRQRRIAARDGFWRLVALPRLGRDHAGGTIARGAKRQVIERWALFGERFRSAGSRGIDSRHRNMTHVRRISHYTPMLLRSP